MNEKDLKLTLELIILKSYPVSRLQIILDCAKNRRKKGRK
jgi:hypothetical protein